LDAAADRGQVAFLPRDRCCRTISSQRASFGYGAVAKLDATGRLKDADLDSHQAVHVAGDLGGVYDLYPNEDVAKALEHFWTLDKIGGAICHGVIAVAKNSE
jgi:putative intracellular protease/amidase